MSNQRSHTAALQRPNHIIAGYLPLARTTFDMEAANQVCSETENAFIKSGIKLVWDGYLKTDIIQVRDTIERMRDDNIDVLIVQAATFVDGQFAVEIAENWKGSIILWSVDEPALKGRLRLNSLTGSNLLAYTFHGLRRKFKFVHGNPSEVMVKISDYLKVLGAIKELKGSTLGVFGRQPNGYYPSAIDELSLARTFGVKIKQYSLAGLFREANNIEDNKAESKIEELDKKIDGLDTTSPETIRTARMYMALDKMVKEDSLLGIAVECWPAFFNEYGAAVCGVLSEFNEIGVMAACEADINGLISMIIESRLAGDSVYFADMVRINHERNSAVFWHCGAGAACLASPGLMPKASVHPNRKMGLVYDFILKPGPVTIMRLDKGYNGLRLFVSEGEALDAKDIHFDGTSVEIKFHEAIDKVVERLFYNGATHHYCIGYGSHIDQLLDFAKELDMEVIKI